MSGVFKKLGGFLLYKEPKAKQWGFELLEDEPVEKQAKQRAQQPQQQAQQTPQPQPQQPQPQPQPQQPQPQPQQDAAPQNPAPDKAVQPGTRRFRRHPIPVEQWNETRKPEKKEQPCQPNTNSDIISAQLCVNLETLRTKFSMPKNQDVVIREFMIGRKVNAFLVFVEGMVDKNTLNLTIFPQLMSRELMEELKEECPADFLMKNVLAVHAVSKTNKYSECITQVLTGQSALYIEGCSDCILMETKGYEKRGVSNPLTETVVKGSQEGFSENLRTNITLVRRIIKSEKLVTEMLSIGNVNHCNCAILYLDGIANPKVIQEVKKRISRINADFIMGDGIIEQFIEDNPFMLFPQVMSTERPDRSASFLMEGQVLIIGEGVPFSMAVPVTFFRLFHTSEDTFLRWPTGAFIRLIRLIGLFLATLLPSIYIAACLFHPEVIPTELLSSMANAREKVPFPLILEVFILEFSFELIREGGIRVPGVIGQTLGIVGALILGQAAVAAGLVSPVLVIVTSVTALGSFAIPNYELGLAIRIEKFFFIVAAWFIGIYGITLMIFLLGVISCSMKSFGVPFFAPIAPRTKINPDVFLRFPIWTQKERPDGMNSPKREKTGQNQTAWFTEEGAGEGEGQT